MLPTTKRIADSHRQVIAHAGRTRKRCNPPHNGLHHLPYILLPYPHQALGPSFCCFFISQPSVLWYYEKRLSFLRRMILETKLCFAIGFCSLHAVSRRLQRRESGSALGDLQPAIRIWIYQKGVFGALSRKQLSFLRRNFLWQTGVPFYFVFASGQIGSRLLA